jgi:hypothetical protein
MDYPQYSTVSACAQQRSWENNDWVLICAYWGALRSLRTLLLLHWGQTRSRLGLSAASHVLPQRIQRNQLDFSTAILPFHVIGEGQPGL